MQKLPDFGELVPFADTYLPLESVKNIVYYAAGISIPVQSPEIEDHDEEESERFVVLERMLKEVASKVGPLRQVCKTWNEMLSYEKIILFKQSDYDTVLRQAVKKSRILTAVMALNRGANIDARMQTKNEKIAFLKEATPLFFAAADGNIAMVKMLLEHGALANIVSNGMLRVRGLVKMFLTGYHDAQVHATYQPIYDLLGDYGAISSSSSSAEDEPDLG